MWVDPGSWGCGDFDAEEVWLGWVHGVVWGWVSRFECEFVVVGFGVPGAWVGAFEGAA